MLCATLHIMHYPISLL